MTLRDRPAKRSSVPNQSRCKIIHQGLVGPMDRENVDTDAIIPK